VDSLVVADTVVSQEEEEEAVEATHSRFQPEVAVVVDSTQQTLRTSLSSFLHPSVVEAEEEWGVWEVWEVWEAVWMTMAIWEDLAVEAVGVCLGWEGAVVEHINNSDHRLHQLHHQLWREVWPSRSRICTRV